MPHRDPLRPCIRDIHQKEGKYQPHKADIIDTSQATRQLAIWRGETSSVKTSPHPGHCNRHAGLRNHRPRWKSALDRKEQRMPSFTDGDACHRITTKVGRRENTPSSSLGIVCVRISGSCSSRQYRSSTHLHFPILSVDHVGSLYMLSTAWNRSRKAASARIILDAVPPRKLTCLPLDWHCLQPVQPRAGCPG